MKFRFIPHTADVKFQAFGSTLEECFINSGYAFKEVICEEKIRNSEKKIIKIKGRDRENLLYNFLEELLYFFDVGGFLVGKISELKIIGRPKLKNSKKIYDYELTAVIYGDNSSNYNYNPNVKAVTYSDMFIKEHQENGEMKFVSQVVLDV